MWVCNGCGAFAEAHDDEVMPDLPHEDDCLWVLARDLLAAHRDARKAES